MARLGIHAILMIVGLGAALLSACYLVPARSSPALETAPAALSWSGIVKPIQLFGLGGTDFARLPMTYSAERLASADERRDLLSFGSFNADAAFLQLSFHRSGQRSEPATTLSADLDALDPRARLSVTRLAGPTSLDTRFGRFQVADLTLVDDHKAMPCLGFRSAPVTGEILRVAGLACGTAERPVGRDLLACIIDRIDLISAGSDDALKAVFVEAERRRGRGCSPAPAVRAGSAKTTWLDATSPPPPLKVLSADAVGR